MLVYQTDGTAGFYYYTGTEWMQLSTTLIKQLADADNDTKVEVEKNTDEDHIRFSTADTTRMIIDEWGRVGIGTSNPENNLTIFSDEDDQGLTLHTADNSFHQGIRFKNAGGWYQWNIYRRGSSPDLVFSSGGSYNVGDFTDKVTFKHGGAVGIGTSDPDASALLEMESNSKGFLPPRMTQAQMEGITNPATGLSVFNTDVNELCYYNGSKWNCMDAQYLFDKTFYCGDNLRDFRDGKSYTTVKIGTQCWMAENLNVGTRIDGSGNQTNNSTIEKYCYNDSTSNCDTYGGLYQWDEMMQYVSTEGTQGICPTGWHLPNDEEWKTMEMYLGMSQSEADDVGYRGTDEGGKMKETGTTHWNSPNTGATNSSGFTGLPGGYRYSFGSFFNLGSYGHWWSSTEYSGTYAWCRDLLYDHDQVYRNDNYKAYGFSVRCLKN